VVAVSLIVFRSAANGSSSGSSFSDSISAIHKNPKSSILIHKKQNSGKIGSVVSLGSVGNGGKVAPALSAKMPKHIQVKQRSFLIE
jgi:hypothetical protein